ncbi:MAG TPA: hypothetical protein VFP33_05200 [Gallionella sp.]|nr:hypothetical protein [Gallionella sp.]
MQKTAAGFIGALFFGIGFCNLAGADSLSGQASQNASGASLHASASAIHAIAASGQATFALSAVPLAIGGSVGAVSGQLAKDSMSAANAPIGTPLKITDEVLTITPPNEALKATAEQGR